MKLDNWKPFTILKFKNWQNLIIFTILLFYSAQFSFTVGKSRILLGYGADYLAFWSAGRIADEKGYSRIYDITNLRSVQLQELNELGLLNKMDASSYSPVPVAILSIFVFPFQILSKINFEPSYWIWTLINVIVLIGYLIYFTRKIFPGNLEKVPGKKLLLLMLISFPVWRNFSEGQVEIFLVICMGEFIRQAINKKPLVSGLWLGGLLLKPQLLILIIPILLFMRYWKNISGFVLSSFVFLITSILLSGVAGMKALVKLWTAYSAGIATSAPEMMINWRMIGVNLNSLLNTSFGWVIMGVGMVLTIVIVCVLFRSKPSFGSSTWIINMAAILSATLAVTWHSHYHMAVVLIPFLIYASKFKLLPEKVVFSWVVVTPLLLLGFQLTAILVFLIGKHTIPDFGYLVAISGFCLNLLIMISALRYIHSNQIITEVPSLNNPRA